LIDEQDKETSEQPEDSQVEETPAEGSEATPAGPVVEEDPSSSQAAGDVPSSTPPAGEASEKPKDEAPAEAAEAPAAEQAPGAEAAGESKIAEGAKAGESAAAKETSADGEKASEVPAGGGAS